MSVEYLFVDIEAANNATIDESRLRLKAIKHFVRAWMGDEDINEKVILVLMSMNIDPSSPWQVVASYPAVIEILKGVHKCKGRECVLKLKRKSNCEKEKVKKNKARKPARETEQDSSTSDSSSSEDESSYENYWLPIHYI